MDEHNGFSREISSTVLTEVKPIDTAQEDALMDLETQNCLARLLSLVPTQVILAEEQYQGKDTFERIYEQWMFEMGEYVEETNDETTN